MQRLREHIEYLERNVGRTIENQSPERVAELRRIVRIFDQPYHVVYLNGNLYITRR